MKAVLVFMAFAPLFSILFTAIENAAFLLYPFRPSATPGDLTAIARNLLMFLAKVLGLALAAGVAVGPGLLVRWLTGSTLTGLIVMWVLGFAASAAAIPLVAYCFKRLDVSADSSPNT
jgi:hypothetical protein